MAMTIALVGLLAVPPTIALLYQTGLYTEVNKLRDCIYKLIARPRLPSFNRPMSSAKSLEIELEEPRRALTHGPTI